MEHDTINVGQYIIIQRQNYKKLHKLNKGSSCISLGKDNVDLTGIEGCRYFSVFKMIPKCMKKNRLYSLELAAEAVDLKQEIDIKSSGTDNRNIIDDGRSQKLSAAEIEDLKCDSNSASDIVGTLISNSNTFHNKTEFSQEKYLKKKEKKYFEFIQIRRPNLRFISEIMYRLDPNKIQGIRMDTLSQIITLANIKSDGNHLLYDSGSNGLLAAALLSVIGHKTQAKLLHMHPGNMSQKQALLAMNFDQEQLERCISVNIYSALRQFYQGCDLNESDTDTKVSHDRKRKEEYSTEPKSKIPKLDNQSENNDLLINEIQECNDITIDDKPKKPKWHFDNIAAAKILTDKMDSLVIACKEDPLNVFNELMPFIKPGRPFVVYYNVAEPLQYLYMTLKSQSNVAALKLTCNWFRNYQASNFL